MKKTILIFFGISLLAILVWIQLNRNKNYQEINSLIESSFPGFEIYEVKTVGFQEQVEHNLVSEQIRTNLVDILSESSRVIGVPKGLHNWKSYQVRDPGERYSILDFQLVFPKNQERIYVILSAQGKWSETRLYKNRSARAANLFMKSNDS